MKCATLLLLTVAFQWGAACGAEALDEHPVESKIIPFERLGAEAQKQYSGDGIAIIPTSDGAKLRAVMQDLEAEATREGLWLTSTADEDANKPNRFRVRAMAIGRERSSVAPVHLSDNGTVRTTREAAVFVRRSLIEQYMVSTDGVRQDFVVMQKPEGNGGLSVIMEVTGAKAEAAAYGVKLTVDATGRELAYTRLKVMDATGKELTARMQVDTANNLRVIVDDKTAIYPIRIDPTFSDADWVSTGDLTGANGGVNALATDASGNLYVAGEFTAIVNILANRIAKWDGSVWTALGAGLNGQVNALKVSGGSLYAGGEFTQAGGVGANKVAKWDGTSWSALGTGIGGTSPYLGGPSVFDLEISGTDLYVCGTFTTAGGAAITNIARWDGSTWSSLGSGTDGIVSTIIMFGSELYAGGSFTTAGGASAPYIAKWNGSTWSPVGGGVDRRVFAFAVSGSTLYVGGDFFKANGVTSNYMAKWDGTNWSTFSSSPGYYVYSIAVSGSTVYAGTGTGGVSKWTGGSWSATTSGLGGSVSALAFIGSTLYVGGAFVVDTASLNTSYLAKLDGTTWSSVGTGVSMTVNSVAFLGSDLYVGGFFKYLNGIYANSVAKWNGSTWSGLAGGVTTADPFSQPGNVRALTVSGGSLYVGGKFSRAGGNNGYPGAAKWNGTSWSYIGGVSLINYQTVNAIAVIGSDVYIGGDFTTTGSLTVNGIAKWNGTAMSALGTGVGGGALGTTPVVYSLATMGTDLYVGGSFTTVDGVTANRIAKWSNGSWSTVGTGMNSSVFALQANGSSMYAGGSFTTAGGKIAKGIARWDGNAWGALGSGISSGAVQAITCSGTDVYVGGQFSSVGGVNANNIAKWNGNTWSALGSGFVLNEILGGVRQMAMAGSTMYVGGGFVTAGGKVSPNLAKATNLDVPEVAVSGNSLDIANEDSTPSTDDGTDFGAVGVAEGFITHVFIVENTGTTGLPLGPVTLSGPYAAEFTVTSQPETIVAAGGSTEFSISFDPQGVGTRTATVSFTSADFDEATFVFGIQGTGTNNAPTDISLSAATITENNTPGTLVGSLSATDLDVGATHTFSLVPGAGSTDNVFFSIMSNSLKLSTVANFEAKSSYSIRIRADDGLSGIFEKVLIVAVVDVNEAPTNIILSSTYITENNVEGAMVGTLSATDVDSGDTQNFSLATGAGSTDNGRFTINGSGLQISERANYEAKNYYQVRIRVTDAGGLFYEKQFTIIVINVNEAPTGISLSANIIAENAPAYTTVGILGGSDPDPSDTRSYSLVSGVAGEDNTRFNISGSVLRLAISADFETKNSYNVRIRVTDSGGLFFEAPFVISILNVNEMPAFVKGVDQTLPIRSVTPQAVSGWATAIDDGDSTETQSMHFNVTVFSGGGLFATSPTVASNGTLSYTPSGVAGTALISVTLTDDSSINGTPARTTAAQTFAIRVEGPGSLDALDAAVVGDHVLAALVQPDGKIILAGSFTSVLGVPRGNIARLNADGTLDTGFDPQANASVYAVAVQPDGDVVLAGSFTALQPNGAGSPSPRGYLARIYENGSLDNTFDPGANGYVRNVALQSDGKILISGDFTALQPNGAASPTTRNHIVRLEPDGTLDPGFDPNANDVVYGLVLQADGKVLLGGDFTTLQPNGAPSATTRRYIARVNSNGTLDAGFDPKANGTVYGMAVQGDGKVLLGGAFSNLQPNGAPVPTTRNYAARLNTNGSLDSDFNPSANGPVFGFALQSDGKVLMSGAFTTLQPVAEPSPVTRSYLARLNAEGALDAEFDPKANGVVYGMALQEDGRILLGGEFTSLQPNGAAVPTTRDLFARLDNESASRSLTVPDYTQVTWTRGTSAPSVEGVTFELSVDAGIHWTELGDGTRIGTTSNWQLTGLSLPAGGLLRAGGRTAGGIYNGSTGLVEHMTAFTAALPEIAVEESEGLSLDSGTSIVDFGMIVSDGSSGAKQFAIRNAGGAPLALGSVTIKGSQSAEFVLDTSGMAGSLAPGQTTSFSVTFTPGANGDRDASMLLASNAPARPSFVVALTGKGVTKLQGWRQQHFGTPDDTGDAADTADADLDGIPNLLEWACNLSPKSPGALPISGTRNGGNIEYIYPRSVAAVNAGAQFAVEWSDTLPPSNWKNEGVTEQVLSDDGTVQIVKAVLPAGESGRRFVHLKVTAN